MFRKVEERSPNRMTMAMGASSSLPGLPAPAALVEANGLYAHPNPPGQFTNPHGFSVLKKGLALVWPDESAA